jgi:hypothetical protein
VILTSVVHTVGFTDKDGKNPVLEFHKKINQPEISYDSNLISPPVGKDDKTPPWLLP